MTILSSPQTPNQEWGRSMRDKHQVIEEPDEKKFSRPVLKESSGKRFPVRLYLMARCQPKVDAETGKYLKNSQAQKRGLNRAIADAAWGELKQKVKVVAAKSGVLVHEINPKHTSQECSCCGYVSPGNRDKEKFLWESCGWIADADVDAAAVIRQRGLSELGINIPLPVVHGKVTLKEPVARQGTSVGLLTEPENPRMEWEQLSLFEWREE